MPSESSAVWDPLKKVLDKLGWHYVRIENSAMPGTPDLNFHIPKFSNESGSDIWVELKYFPLEGMRKLIDSDVINIGLRREQYIWLRDAKRAGRRVCLVAKVGMDWWLWFDELDFAKAKKLTSVEELRQRVLIRTEEEGPRDVLLAIRDYA